MAQDEVLAQYINAPRVIVAGGRDFCNYTLMSTTLDEYFKDKSEAKIISGMADGADTLAIRYADEHKMTKILFPANWKRHPRRAGFLRNEDMLTIATDLVAFWDGQSHGTMHMIEIAKARGILTTIISYQNG